MMVSHQVLFCTPKINNKSSYRLVRGRGEFAVDCSNTTTEIFLPTSRIATAYPMLQQTAVLCEPALTDQTIVYTNISHKYEDANKHFKNLGIKK